MIVLSLFLPDIKNYYSYNQYAKIMENTALYQDVSSKENSNIICLLEPTYFVEIISDYNDEFYLVNYNGLEGYALKNKTKKVSSTPSNPCPNYLLTTFSNKCNLRSSPKNDGTVLVPIPANTNINYIGKVYGEAIMDYNGEIWYLVEYLGIKGYIYNGYVLNIPIITPNTEEINFLETKEFLTVNPLSNETCIIIISLILVPSVIILILLFKKPRIVPKKQKIIRSNDKIDYDSLL